MHAMSMQVKSCAHRLLAVHVSACPETLIQISCLFDLSVSHVLSLFPLKPSFICLYVVPLFYVLVVFNMFKPGFLCLFLVLMPCHSFICPCIIVIDVVLLQGK